MQFLISCIKSPVNSETQLEHTFGLDVLDSAVCFYSQEMMALELVAQHVPAESFLTAWSLARNSAKSTAGHDDYWLYSDKNKWQKVNILLSGTATMPKLVMILSLENYTLGQKLEWADAVLSIPDKQQISSESALQSKQYRFASTQSNESQSTLESYLSHITHQLDTSIAKLEEH